MSGDTMPETPTEGGRVYRALTVDQLKTYATDASSGYAVANELRKSVENNLTDQARSNLAAGYVHAVGFEVEVDLNSGTGPPPFLGFQGAIGVSMVWLVGATDDADIGPHIYAFANQGENGVEAIGDAPDSSTQIDGSFFATYFGGDRDDLTPAAWKEALGTVGVDAGGGRGLLSGEVTLYSTSDSVFFWNQRDVWYAFVADLAVTNGGTTVSVTESNYAFYEWLLGQLGLLQAGGDSSWDVPEHLFWEVLDGLVPDWGGGSTATGGATGGENEVCFPSGECLAIVDEPDDKADWWPESDDYWDPFDSGNPVLDTSDDGVDLSTNFSLDEYTSSRNPDRARIDPALIRFLEAFRAEVNERAADEADDPDDLAELAIAITSGYRSLSCNRGAYDWPSIADIDRWETVEGDDGYFVVYPVGDAFPDHDRYDPDAAYKFPDQETIYTEGRDTLDNVDHLLDQETIDAVNEDDGPTVVKLTQSEHMTGRGADVRIVSVTNGENPYQTASVDDENVRHDRLVEVAKIAQETPAERDVEGVTPCDIRVGIYDGASFFHVDVKPRDLWGGVGAGYWGAWITNEVINNRTSLDQEHGCGGN